MRISLFESAEAILLRMFDALFSEIAPKIPSLDVNMLDLVFCNHWPSYKFCEDNVYFVG